MSFNTIIGVKINNARGNKCIKNQILLPPLNFCTSDFWIFLILYNKFIGYMGLFRALFAGT
jgi:hypothetical protein